MGMLAGYRRREALAGLSTRTLASSAAPAMRRIRQLSVDGAAVPDRESVGGRVVRGALVSARTPCVPLVEVEREVVVVVASVSVVDVVAVVDVVDVDVVLEVEVVEVDVDEDEDDVVVVTPLQSFLQIAWPSVVQFSPRKWKTVLSVRV